MNTNESELLDELKESACSLDRYLPTHKNIFINEDISSFWNRIINNKNFSKSNIINKADFCYCYFYEVINGRKKPTKDKVVRLALAMEMTFDECQQALRISGRSFLHPKNRRDSIIIYAIEREMTVLQCNNLLNSHGENELK